MLSKCANPNCKSTLHYLREGKVFKVESATPALFGKKPQRRVEHFWLCGPCSVSQTLIYDEAGAIEIMPKEILRRAAAS